MHNINVIRMWPGKRGLYLDKIPTVIDYRTTPPSWGRVSYQEPQAKNFKLLLQENVAKYYRQQIRSHSFWTLGAQIPDKTAVDFTADFLTCIYNYIHNEHLPRQYGKVFIKQQSICYILTVPIFWNDATKALIRLAAKRAGIHNDHLILVTEAEAAAFYCTAMGQVDLTNGDVFLVCDAGGGTIV